MFKKHSGRRSANPLFIIFRLFLSLTMFVILLIGAYSAYKHFSGLDPLKLDPQFIISNAIGSKTPKEFLGFLSALKIDPKILSESKGSPIPQDTKQPEVKTARLKFKFLLIADSHNDNINLQKALNQAKKDNPNLAFIIGLGDYTDVGTVGELKAAKKELDSADLRYFLIAGDHDLWDSRDKQNDPLTNFKSVFGLSYQSFTFQDFRFILLYNSDNYAGMSDEQLKWLTDELEKSKENQEKGIFVFVHEPLFHPSSDHVVGRVEKSLKVQAKQLIYQLKEAGVKKVFAGDIHYFSEYEEPETNLSMVTVGALVTDRNPEIPRYAVVTVFEDGNTTVDDIEVK